jgi:hypothetical protein
MKRALTLFLLLVILIPASVFAHDEGEGEEEDDHEYTTPITGWAWSDNIGWISLSCIDTDVCATSNYGLSRRRGGNGSVGNIEGHAWSEHVGWVATVTALGGSGCPSNPCKTTIQNNGKIHGWLKVLNATNGWDGWIHIGSTSSNGTYGLQFNYGQITGWAWGSNVTGWIFFSAHLSCSSFEGDLCEDGGWVFRDTETLIVDQEGGDDDDDD